MQIIRYGSDFFLFLMCPDFSFLHFDYDSFHPFFFPRHAMAIGQGLMISCNKQHHADGLYWRQVYLFILKIKVDIYIYNYIFVCVIIRVSREHETYMSKNITI